MIIINIIINNYFKIVISNSIIWKYKKNKNFEILRI